MTIKKREMRKESYDYSSLSFLGKISSWFGSQKIILKLKKGNWIDVQSGYKSSLQFSQINNKKISKFYSIDHSLSKLLKTFDFQLKEMIINKKLPYAGNFFDNVTSINGLEHLFYPQNVLNEFYRILKPGGILQIIVPTWFGKPFLEFLAFNIKNKQAFIEMNDHKMYYDEKMLWPMLVKAGFKPNNINIKRIKLYCSLYAVAIKD